MPVNIIPSKLGNLSFLHIQPENIPTSSIKEILINIINPPKTQKKLTILRVIIAEVISLISGFSASTTGEPHSQQ